MQGDEFPASRLLGGFNEPQRRWGAHARVRGVEARQTSVSGLNWAEWTATCYLHAMGPRMDHVRAVAALAHVVAPAVGDASDEFVAAAWLHDIGYSESLALSGFHPLDGARAVRGYANENVARLVAHHSSARYEARLRGIDLEAEFPFLEGSADDALTYCDMTTGPTGARVTFRERLTEILSRYGENHVVSRGMLLAEDSIRLSCERTEARATRAGILLPSG